MLEALHLNKLQRKVLLVIVLIILVPMLVTGVLSGRWVSARIDESIEHWLRESIQLDEGALGDLHRNARLFASAIQDVTRGHWKIRPGETPIPANLQPLARELGLTLIQVYGVHGELLYTSKPVTVDRS